MPPSPTTIPTSFVPKQPVRASAQPGRGGSNLLMMVAFGLLAVSLLSSVLIFAYERFLMSTRDAKAEEVRVAEGMVNEETVEGFIRSRNRFSVAKTMLDNHVATSRFFTVLERTTLENVRFNTLALDVLDDGSGKLEMAGVARTFNALAAQSRALAGERNIRRAIFSDIAVAPNDTVSFTLTAELDPDIITFELESMPPEAAPVELEPAMLEGDLEAEVPVDDGGEAAAPAAPAFPAGGGGLPSSQPFIPPGATPIPAP